MATYFDTVIFDLDGTLLNSIDDLADSINMALEQCGFLTHTTKEVQRYVGDGVEMLVRRALPHSAVQADYNAVYNAFSTIYAENMYNKTRPYPGILELLAQLSGCGVQMAVVSNKFQAAVTPLIQSYFGDYIGVSVGTDENTPTKPDPSGVLKAMQALGAVRERTVYMGDSDVDIMTAKNAGVFSVACTWGLRDITVLQAAQPDVLIDSPTALLPLLQSSIER
ncbi:MAG: HAD family hydrolase [Candidatus Fimivivens sp.]